MCFTFALYAHTENGEGTKHAKYMQVNVGFMTYSKHLKTLNITPISKIAIEVKKKFFTKFYFHTRWTKI